jgi:hypothetical protein
MLAKYKLVMAIDRFITIIEVTSSLKFQKNLL